MKTEIQIKRALIKLSKKQREYSAIKLRCVLDDRMYHAQLAQNDIDFVQGQMTALWWVSGIKKTKI